MKSIVAMPRNIFIDTPTLTSLLFAQKKSAEQIAAWDTEWKAAFADSEARIKAAAQALTKGNASGKTAKQVSAEFLGALSPLATARDWVLKTGKSAAVLQLGRQWTSEVGEVAAAHFREILRGAGFQALRERYVFGKVARALDANVLGFEVSEVGYKLSKRKERAKPNDLLRFVGESGREHCNLHLTDEPINVVVDAEHPKRVLDHMRNKVSWN